MAHVWTTVIAVLAGLLLLWLALLIALAVTRPADLRVTDLLRLLPDTVILLRRLAADPRSAARGSASGWCCCWAIWFCRST